MQNRSIEVTNISVKNDNEIHATFKGSNSLRRAFTSNRLVFKYSTNISSTPISILAVPVLASLAPTSWILQSELVLPEIDEYFYYSLKKINSIYQDFYPKLSLPFDVKVKTKTINQFNGAKTALLFSGGLDATYSHLKHISENPDLFLIFGSEIPVNNEFFVSKTKKVYQSYADEIQAKIFFIESNLHDVINSPYLNYRFSSKLDELPCYQALNISLALTSYTAPITYRNFSKLIIASSYHSSYNHHYGSEPVIDNNIRWSDLRVSHDGYDITRMRKVSEISDYVKETDVYPPLRVCNQAPIYEKDLNCGKCEKCLRTMTSLLSFGLDPEKFHLTLNKDYIELSKKGLDSKSFFKLRDKIWFWKDIQQNLPQELNKSDEIQSYLEWLQRINIPDKPHSNSHKMYLKNLILLIVSYLPRNIRFALRKLYNQ